MHSRKADLAFCRLAHRTVRCTTEHCPVQISFLIWRSRPLAHRTVRCPLLIVGSATRRARIPWPTVGPADCWLTGQSGAPLDSPVNFSRTPPTKSREQLVEGCQPGAPDTVRCTTGQSGAPRLSRLLAASSHSFSIAFSLILTLRQTC